MIEQRLGDDMNQTPQVEYQENHDKIKQYHDRRGANLVHRLRYRKRHGVELPHDGEEQQRETKQKNDDNQRLPEGWKRNDRPNMPTYIYKGQDWQYHKQQHPHIITIHL